MTIPVGPPCPTRTWPAHSPYNTKLFNSWLNSPRQKYQSPTTPLACLRACMHANLNAQNAAPHPGIASKPVPPLTAEYDEDLRTVHLPLMQPMALVSTSSSSTTSRSLSTKPDSSGSSLVLRSNHLTCYRIQFARQERIIYPT